MNILSLFDGKSSGYTACEIAGIPVDNYYSSEVDKYAIQVSDAIHPNQTRLGDVTRWRDWDIDWASIDLVTGGFPCQPFSVAGKQLGDKDERGMLFWTMLDVMKHVRHFNPNAHFLIENVKMKKEFEEYITMHTETALGHVHKILINSALVSAQNRQRYYWTSFPVEQPEDRGIVWGDVREHGVNEFYYTEQGLQWMARHSQRKAKTLNVWANDEKAQMVEASHFKNYSAQRFFGICDLPTDSEAVASMRGRRINLHTGARDDYNKSIKPEQYIEFKYDGKSNCLSTVTKDNIVVPFTLPNRIPVDLFFFRYITPRECFRLQTVPEHYIDKILNYGELYSHCQNFYNRLTGLKARDVKCKSVKFMTVGNQSQAEKLSCAINTTLDSLDTELQKQLENLSIKVNYVQEKGASVTVKLQKGCALSTIKHGSESMTSLQESVRFVLKTSAVDGVECALGTLNQNQNMETQIKLILTPEENSNLMGIKASNISKTQTVDGLIELLQKRLSEESSSPVKQYTILTAINLIIAKAIFLYASLEHNTYLCIDSLSQLQCNSLELAISTLKAENIKPTSNSNLYKVAGNGWTDEVIAHILRELK